MNERKLAYEILKESYLDKAYVNLVLKNKLKLVDNLKRPFIVEIVNGVIRNDLFLKYQFQHLINNNTKESVIILLMMAYYEKIFMDNVEYAIVNEYVKISNKKYKAIINAVLRNNLTIKKDLILNSDENLSIYYSLPLWILKMIKSQHSKEFLNEFLNDYKNYKPKLFYHLNTLKINKKQLNNSDIEFIDEEIFISKKSLIETEEFVNGYFYIQDLGAKQITDHLDVNNKKRIIDVCAAPGSKSFNILEKIKDKQNLYINDINANRLSLIKDMALKLGYSNLNFINVNACELESLNLTFDCILADVPCSGLGVLKRKTDLKNKIKPENIDEIILLQEKILDSCYKVLEANGQLLYSTCTINTKENHKQILRFLNKYNDMKLIEDKIIFNKNGSDIFYIAKMIKI